MKYNTIPGTEIKVSALCLGTMNAGQQNTESELHAQLDYALEHGINFIDTAEIYPIPPEKGKQGTTERYLGSWLKNRGKRDDLVIASKVACSPFISTRSYDGEYPRYTRASIREAIEGSLTRLGVEYLDLYQVHFPERRTNFFGVRGVDFVDDTTSTPIEETLEALTELVKEGKVRAIGVSNETPWGLNEYLRLSREKGLARVATIQNQYSLINRSFEIGLSEIALKENVGLLVYSPLSTGVLTGKYLHGTNPPGARHTLYERNRVRYNNPDVQPAIEQYVNLAKAHGLDPAAMAVAFCVARPFVTSTILGATTLEQLAVDIAGGEAKLSPEVWAGIDEIYRSMPDPQA